MTEDVAGEASNTEIDVPFWIGSEGGTINNNGIDTTFAGAFKDVLLAAFSSRASSILRHRCYYPCWREHVYGSNEYRGRNVKVTGTLSDSTAVTVASGAIYGVDKTDEIGSIAGAGSVDLATGSPLTAGGTTAPRCSQE